MLKREGLKPYLFEEQKTMGKLEEVYSDKGEGTWKAVSFANNLSKLKHTFRRYLLISTFTFFNVSSVTKI